MAKYDGLIIPRSYNDYINKSDPAGVAQALQLTGVMDNAPTAQSTKPAKSGGIFAANAVIMANNKTLSGVAISAGSVVRVLFTAAITGSNSTTGLTLTYNGNAYAVKVGKNGALANFLANNIDGSYIYCQAYTTLELMFDGSQFIIMGNPVVISSADYTIYTDGSKIYTANGTKKSIQYEPKCILITCKGNSSSTLEIENNQEIQIDAIFYGGLAERAIFSRFLNVDSSKKTIFSGTTPGHSMSISGTTITLSATRTDIIYFKIMYL